MTNYNVKLTPQLINLATEGSQDSSVLNGKSYQRTFNMYQVENNGNRKIIDRVPDGGQFNDTTFQNSTGIGTFESGLTFTADQILDAGNSFDSNGFVGVGAILEISQEQAAILNNYGYIVLFFNAKWAAGSHYSDSVLVVFPISGDVFEDVIVVVPFDAQIDPVCDNEAIWNMPVDLTNFIEGFNP